MNKFIDLTEETGAQITISIDSISAVAEYNLFTRIILKEKINPEENTNVNFLVKEPIHIVRMLINKFNV